MRRRFAWLQDAALASERYGKYLLNVVDDKDKAVYCFEKALRYYKDWGANAKVAQINEKYSHLFSVPSKIEIPFDDSHLLWTQQPSLGVLKRFGCLYEDSCLDKMSNRENKHKVQLVYIQQLTINCLGLCDGQFTVFKQRSKKQYMAS